MASLKDVAALVAVKIGITQKDAREAVDATVEAIKELSLDGTVTCAPLGTFKVKERAAREGRNPATGEALHIDAKEVLTFKPTDKEVVRPKKAAPAKKEEKAAPAKKGGRRK